MKETAVERHLETYRRIHQLRDRLSQRYAELLREKVLRQRQEIKHHDSVALKNRARHSEELFSFLQRTGKLTVHKLPGSTLQHDDTYLKALPKTRHYLILELERLLTQRGFLRGLREQEVFRFWVDQHKTVKLEKQLQQMVFSSKSAPVLKLEDLLKEKQEPLPKIQISNDDSPARDEHAAVSESGGGVKADSLRLQGKQSQEQDQAELKFPSVFSQELKVPMFSTLKPGFMDTFKTNVLLLKVNEPLHKSKAATVTQQKLHLMHRLSLSHMAYTQRLLDKNGLALQYDKGFSISELLEHVCQRKVSTEEPIYSRKPLSPLLSPKDYSKTEYLEQEKLVLASDQDTSSQKSKDAKVNISGASDPEVPLCMEDINPYSVSQGKDFSDRTWTNYVS
ncbi:uncharacterized protein si:ch211-130h14.4 isoform X2 [Hoplias malabaricus]|uniref:uncharacterized protein si:ch211-130h14.4 isoform X2 n=1 Tax=Hoplias malabaricus TaxID=27720 RepID=UPI0034626F17